MKKWSYICRFWPIYLLSACILLSMVLCTSQTVTTIAQNSPIPRVNTIVIDAGHGGEDGGATSCTGVLESTFNLQICLRLNDLCHLLGMDTVMIRTSDISVYTEGNTIAAKKASDLRQRVKIVSDTQNAILVSIHQNAFPDGRYSGAQVFYASTGGSIELAKTLQDMFVKTINPNSKRRCKPADYVYLMQHIPCPGVLIECGFLSNAAEEANLRSAEYQKKICCVIVTGLSAYINA